MKSLVLASDLTTSLHSSIARVDLALFSEQPCGPASCRGGGFMAIVQITGRDCRQLTLLAGC